MLTYFSPKKECISAIMAKELVEDEIIILSNRPLKPEKSPRQHAFIYIFLIFCTLVLLCFYSIPLNSNSITTKPLSNMIPTAQLSEDISPFIKNDRLQIDDKVLNELIKEESLTSSSSASDSEFSSLITSEELKSTFNEISIETTFYSVQETQTPSEESTLIVNENSSTVYTEQSTVSGEKTNFSNEVSSLNENNISTNQFNNRTENISTDGPNRDEFLVFSQHCKIPDIDPYHPSILKFVEETPPLVCKQPKLCSRNVFIPIRKHSPKTHSSFLNGLNQLRNHTHYVTSFCDENRSKTDKIDAFTGLFADF
ncbi:uncharacterized protein NPIL_178521 [Nephila pilipes]|uniref:Uncharacterized protein n=1 Tax=Nephila pilipes TaxID=299642 RepID=A0A8X6N4Z0_NEPPI|nr:uncharacterized protein NPIL_178521 [Nephila pilipes]